MPEQRRIQVRTRIREVMQPFLSEEELSSIFKGEPILTTLTIDSLSLLKMVVELESTFNVSFDYDTIETAFANIDSLSEFLACETRKSTG